MTVWKVIQMLVKPQVDGFTDVVYMVNWLATSTDGVNEVRKGGTTEVPLPAGGTFVPYDQLTEAQVIDWVKTQLGPEEVSKIENDLNSQLAYIANPTVISLPIPWSS